MTEYKVLASNEVSGVWVVVEDVSAPTAVKAIEIVVSKNAEATATEYVAIPLRSWAPKKVSVTTKTSVKLT